MRQIVIIGAGGFAAEGAWAIEDINSASVQRGEGPPWKLLGFAVYDPSKYPASLYSYPILGTPKAVAEKFGRFCFICMIGDNRVREAESRQAQELGLEPASLVHPTVVRARETTVGPGSYVGAGSIISPFAKLGFHVVVNHHVSVGHDSTMEDFSHACPGARISGKCVVEKSALIGSNATLLPGCRVGHGAVVGAGSVALRRVPPGSTVMGVPARRVSTDIQEKECD